MSTNVSSLVVSICMATFNRARLLPRAIESVLRQNYADWELVIVDDGSTDDSPRLLEDYARRHPDRIRTTRQANSGLVAARNLACAMATGEWMTFLDSDDEYEPEHLELRVNYLREHPDVEFLHGGLRIVGGSDRVPDLHNPQRLISIHQCAVGGTFFVRAHVFQQLGGFRPPDYGCDHDLLSRALTCVRVEKVDFPTYVYHRDTLDSMCTNAERRNANRGTRKNGNHQS